LSTILAPIDDVVAWIITHLFNAFSPIFGVASGVTWLLVIVVLVVLMRLILVPLFIKQMHTQRAMTALSPQLAELRKKHKGDKERLNQETMKLYQQAGVNPLMGCLPVLLQMPIFFALFSVLRYIAEWTKAEPLKYHLTASMINSAQTAKIFGATIADKVLFTHGLNVPLHAKVVIVFAVVISMTTTYLTVRQSMKRGMMPTGSDSPMGQSQKMMAYVMPLFALTGLYWQFGLVLYWVTTNVWTLGQQFVLLRRFPVGVPMLGQGTGKSGGGLMGRAAAAQGLTSGSKPRPGGTGSGTNSGGGAKGNSAKGTSAKDGSTTNGSAKGGSTTNGSAKGGSTTDGAGKAPADANPADSAGAANGQATSPAKAAPAPKGTATPGAKSSTPGDAKGTAPGSAKSSAPAGAKGTAPGAKGTAAGGAKPAASSGSAKASSGGPSSGGPSLSKPAASAANGAGSNGHKPAGGDGGLLRRFGRSKPESEPAAPAQPDTKIVRQQPQRQSRSKRSGKR
jgi:YidC/Oxa1 family membrane protein insertase